MKRQPLMPGGGPELGFEVEGGAVGGFLIGSFSHASLAIVRRNFGDVNPGYGWTSHLSAGESVVFGDDDRSQVGGPDVAARYEAEN